LEAIVAVLAEGGLPLEQIMERLDFPIKKRTLQRRLKELREGNRVLVLGEARATIYLPKGELREPQLPIGPSIPLSPQGKEILTRISRPESQRNPVGYNRDFLEGYRPNMDRYLSLGDLSKLAEMGKTRGEHQAAGTYALKILNRLLIDLAWNSSRLEGNTYSLLDTEILFNQSTAAQDKTPMETQMILNHKDAIEFLVDPADEIGFNRYTLLNLHALLSNNLLSNPAASGRLRELVVGIGKSTYTPLGIPQRISELFDLLLEKTYQIKNPFEQAFFVLVHFPYLQPFEDVNKRVSRLAANLPFINHNLSPLTFMDVPREYYIKGLLGIYEENRIDLFKDVFIWAYERSARRYSLIRHNMGEPDSFRLKYREGIREAIQQVVLNAMTKDRAIGHIKVEARKVAPQDRSQFIETVDRELLDLHEGNFARYRISPSEFKRWKAVWES